MDTVNEKKIKSILICFIILLSNAITFKQYLPVSSDECAYIGQASLIAGNNWSDVTSQLNYFSFGSSIIIGLLWRIINSPAIFYRVVLFINSLILVTSFLLCDAILKNIYLEMKDIARHVVSAITVIYAPYICYSDYHLSELYSVLGFWINIFCLVKYSTSKHCRYLYIFSISTVWMYFIHLRNIAICFAGVCIFLYLIIKKATPRKSLFFCVLLAVVTAVPLELWKNYSTDILWNVENIYKDVNTFSGTEFNNYLSLIKDTEFWSALFRCLLGRIWYLYIGSLGVGFFALFLQLKSILSSIKNGKKIELWRLYIVLSFFTLLGMVSLISWWPTRVDHIIFGRYLDTLWGPYILLGISEVINPDNRQPFIKFSVGGIILILTIGKIIEDFTRLAHTMQNELDSSCGIRFLLNNPYEHGDFIKITTIYTLILVFTLVVVKKRTTKPILFILTSLFLLNSIAGHIYMYNLQQERLQVVETFDNYIVDFPNEIIGYFPQTQLVNMMKFNNPDLQFSAIYSTDEDFVSAFNIVVLEDWQIKNLSKYALSNYEVFSSDGNKYYLLMKKSICNGEISCIKQSFSLKTFLSMDLAGA